MKQIMKKSLWLRLCLTLALFITLYGSLGISASAQPLLPHAFYGTVEIAGQPAPAGTKVEVRSGGARLDIGGNPLTTTETGKYGGPGLLDDKLFVQGDLADGDELEFYVNEMRAQCYVEGVWVDTFPYEAGGLTDLNLRTEAAAPTPGPSPTPQPSPTPTSSPTPVSSPTPGPSPTPTSTPTPGPSPTSTSAPATSTPASTSTPGPSPTPASTSTPGPSPTPASTSTPGPSPTPASTSTPGPSPTPASTATPGPSPTSTATSKPSTPGPSPTSALGLSPTPITTPGGESEGPSALQWIAIVALVVLGGAAIAFGVWGLKRRGAE